MDENRFQRYFDELGGKQLLGEEQERDLSSRIKKGDQRAISRLAEANIRLVAHIAREYLGNGLAIDDLVSEGNIGLMKAASKYDASRGLRFAGFAVVHIRREIERALERENSEKTIQNNSGNTQRRSLDAPLGAKPGINLLSVLTDNDSPDAEGRAYSAAIEERVERALRSLNERETKVVSAYYGIGQDYLTMAEIAQDMGLKRERVRQIRNRAVRRMRKAFRSFTLA
jgi:RNA polymerase primary sigma factor